MVNVSLIVNYEHIRSFTFLPLSRLTPCTKWVWWRLISTLSYFGQHWRCLHRRNSASSSSSLVTKNEYLSLVHVKMEVQIQPMFHHILWRLPHLTELQVLWRVIYICNSDEKLKIVQWNCSWIVTLQFFLRQEQTKSEFLHHNLILDCAGVKKQFSVKVKNETMGCKNSTYLLIYWEKESTIQTPSHIWPFRDCPLRTKEIKDWH